MDAEAALRSVLVADATVTGLVPAERIVAGVMPQGTILPAISIEGVSGTFRNIPDPGANRFVNERVDVFVHARNKPSQQQILRAIRKAAADKYPSVTGLQNVTIHVETLNPAFTNEEASIYLRSQTFRVTYSETR